MTGLDVVQGDLPLRPPGTQTLARGLEVVRAVANGATDLKTVCLATGIGRSTAHRLIQMLEQFGYLRSAQGAAYSLGPTLIELGFQALYQSPASTVARPFLELLSKKYLDTIHLAIEEEGQVLYVDKISGSRGAEMRSRIGYRMPLSQTGIGKALLLDEPHRWENVFDLEHDGVDVPPETRALFLRRMATYARQGSSLDLEENEPGIRCVAAPVRNGSGAVVAAISISAITPYMPMERMKALQPVLQQTAMAISKRLGYSGDQTSTTRT
jgi:DNA-binding IclR family transcriptional regulator